MNRTVYFIVSLLVIVLALTVVYNVCESQFNTTELEIYSEGPIPLSDIIDGIENKSHYGEYDNETVEWLKSLGDMYAFPGNGTFVVMDRFDAGTVPGEYATDVDITIHIECKVLERRSLGNDRYPLEFILVKNVKCMGVDITQYPV